MRLMRVEDEGREKKGNILVVVIRTVRKEGIVWERKGEEGMRCRCGSDQQE